jgi:hypothetical protein
MHPSRRRHQQQQSVRHHVTHSDSYAFFNLLTSPQLFDQVESLLQSGAAVPADRNALDVFIPSPEQRTFSATKFPLLVRAGVNQTIPGACPKCGMGLVPEGTRFAMLRHMIKSPLMIIIMVAVMVAIMAAIMMMR